MMYFESMNFINKPDLLKLYGIPMVDTNGKGWSKYINGHFDEKTFDPANTRLMAYHAADNKRRLVLDLEDTLQTDSRWPWDLQSHAQREVWRACDDVKEIVDTIRKYRPEVKIGGYGILVRNYWTPVSGTQADKARWRFCNAKLAKRLGGVFDFICPSLYTFYDDVPNWEKFAAANIENAQRWNIPVIPYLWFMYHNAAKPETLRGQFLPKSTVEAQLAYLKPFADGVVMWGGQGQTWNEDSDWWQVFKKYATEVKS